MRIYLFWVLATVVAATASIGQSCLAETLSTISAADIDAAEFVDGPLPEKAISPLLAKLQILLDVRGASPGVIDGRDGKNLTKALAAFQMMSDLPVTGQLDGQTWAALPKAAPIKRYSISAEDLKVPFIPSVPSDYGQMAKLKLLSYTGPIEMFGERFHMSEELLRALNPTADFGKLGTVLIVAAIDTSVTTPVVRLIADKNKGQLFGLDEKGKVVVAYPASIGSPETPSPSGTYKITGIAINPTYHYKPDVNFKQGNNDKPLTIAAGPNNPVGSVWIDLSKPTYGIHGTPAPSKIDRTYSHGCVRLANWDVLELAKLVKKGVEVEFR